MIILRLSGGVPQTIILWSDNNTVVDLARQPPAGHFALRGAWGGNTAGGAIHSVESTESGRLYLYNYDSKGQLIGYTECGKDANGNYTSQLQNFYVYDERDRIDYWQGSFDYVASNGNTYSDAVGYGYDYLDYEGSSTTNVGQLNQLTVSEAGLNRNTTITYSYDALYRLSGKTLKTPANWTITTGYAFRGTSTNTSMLVSNYSSTVNVNGSFAITSYVYTYDVDGNITQISDSNGNTISYEYDNLGQLTRENNEVLGKAFVYTYDNGGNRTSKVTYAYSNGTTGAQISSESYTYGNTSWGDQLTSYNGTAIEYDEIGNPKTFNGYTLSWHGRQLKEMNRNSGQSVLKFKYNADGIRTSKEVNNVEHIYTLNGTQIVSEEWDGNLLIYLYDESGSPIGMQYRTTSYAAYTFDTFYFEKNLQGDIIAVYNASGVKVLSYTYDAWGNHTTTWHNSAGTNLSAYYNPFRYRGYYYDTETQLYYLQSRYYNPAWGRFLNADGLISTGTGLLGYNMYAYCNNNPACLIDSEGEFPWIIVAVAAIALVTLAVDHALAKHYPDGISVSPPPDEDDRLQERFVYAKGGGFECSQKKISIADLDVGFYKATSVYESGELTLVEVATANASASIDFVENNAEASFVASIYTMSGSISLEFWGYKITIDAELHVGAVGGGVEFDLDDGKGEVVVPGTGIIPSIGWDVDKTN